MLHVKSKLYHLYIEKKYDQIMIADDTYKNMSRTKL